MNGCECPACASDRCEACKNELTVCDECRERLYGEWFRYLAGGRPKNGEIEEYWDDKSETAKAVSGYGK